MTSSPRTLSLAYGIALICFLALDACWLATMGPMLYRPSLGHLMAAASGLAGGGAVLPCVCRRPGLFRGASGGSTPDAPVWRCRRGAVLGLMAYATYDLTNQATLRGWPWALTLIDLAWGGHRERRRVLGRSPHHMPTSEPKKRAMTPSNCSLPSHRGQADAFAAVLHDRLVMDGAVRRVEVAGSEQRAAIVEAAAQHLCQFDAIVGLCRGRYLPARCAAERRWPSDAPGTLTRLQRMPGPIQRQGVGIAMGECARPGRAQRQSGGGALAMTRLLACASSAAMRASVPASASSATGAGARSSSIRPPSASSTRSRSRQLAAEFEVAGQYQPGSNV
jgi:uncharacterized membrane protein